LRESLLLQNPLPIVFFTKVFNFWQFQMVSKALQAPLLTIKSQDHVSKREKKKMENMSHDFGCAHWNV